MIPITSSPAKGKQETIMPRIEIIPAGWEESKERAQGDGSPTIDICEICYDNNFAGCEGELFHPEVGVDPELDKIDKQFPGARIGSIDVEHPSFEDESYHCEICGTNLSEDDD
jgi:hypothetical protein